ncbi:MAG: hypothetical protein KBT34_03005 [Prevotella sp.]|nr:hypothetical protein [Candidatus Prevotella equi]
MNTILSTLLILALAIAIFFDFIRIIQYIQSKKFMDKSNNWAENKFKEVNSQITQLQTNADLIYAMEEDNRTYKDVMLKRTTDIQKQILNIVSTQYKQYKQLKDIQDTLHKIEKRK